MKITHQTVLLLVPVLLFSSTTGAQADTQFDLSSIQNSAAQAYTEASSYPAQLGGPVPDSAAQGPASNTVARLVAGRSSGSASGLRPTQLPVVSTGSVDLNIVDLASLHGNGGSSQGGAGGVGGSGGNGSGSQVPPNLPPGYAAVMCHGTYAGAIPPGGHSVDFWNGAYGFAGDAQQQAALLQEGQWLRDHGQLDGM